MHPAYCAGGWVGRWMDGRRINLSIIFLGKNPRFFFFQQAKNRALRWNMDSKIDTFCQIDTRVLAILGVKKIVFVTFSKLFWSYLGSV